MAEARAGDTVDVRRRISRAGAAQERRDSAKPGAPRGHTARRAIEQRARGHRRGRQGRALQRFPHRGRRRSCRFRQASCCSDSVRGDRRHGNRAPASASRFAAAASPIAARQCDPRLPGRRRADLRPCDPWLSHNSIRRNKGAGVAAATGRTAALLAGNVFEGERPARAASRATGPGNGDGRESNFLSGRPKPAPGQGQRERRGQGKNDRTGRPRNSASTRSASKLGRGGMADVYLAQDTEPAAPWR